MLLACHLDWLPGLHRVVPVIHLPGSLWCNLHPWWCFMCWYLLMGSRVSLWIRLLFSGSASALNPCVSYSQDTCLFFFFIYVTVLPGYPAFCVSQLPGNGEDLHGVSPTDEHAASHALCGLCTPRQIANGVCTIEQVKLAASVWFSEDESDAGFCFTYQPGLVPSQKGRGEMHGRTSGGSRI